MSFRLDRFLALYFFYPFAKRRMDKMPRVPILMYHSISDGIEDAHPYYHTCTAPDIFETHLRYLKDNNYKVLSLEKIADLLDSYQVFPERAVGITFDDGFRDFYTVAAPLLKELEFTADIFLPTAYISDDNLSFKGTTCLNWEEIRQLYIDGFHFGSHTVTHPVLSSMNTHEVESEIKLSKEIIEKKIGDSVNIFSYPYAFPDNEVGFAKYICKILKENSYKVGVTTRIGKAVNNDMPFLLKRIPVNSRDDLKFFEAKLKGGYDWLYLPQYLYKKYWPIK